MKVEIYVQPGAKKSGYAGEFDGKIKIKISAPPVEGAANKEVVKFFSKILKVSKSNIEIVSGLQSRHKVLEINTDLSDSEVLKILENTK